MCGCGGKKTIGAPQTYIVTLPGGKQKVYSSEAAAIDETKRTAGATMTPSSVSV